METMNLFDVVSLSILSYCVLRGIFRGIIKEASAIIGVIAGFYCSYTYYGLAAKKLALYITTPAYANIAGFLLVFSVVFGVINLIGTGIRYVLNIALLGWADRLSGAVFGGIKAIMISSVILIALTTFLPSDSPTLAGSKTAPYITSLSETMIRVVPQEFKTEFRNKIKGVRKIWDLRKD
ncbi:CvpA family protein [Desulforegula conservatrix]|uniref:CvpA family protein n=1 Tax=Desulforegula conservatrix TaxID=153026 RepID=UPI0003FAD152|nr:CvpA family protein [Desulforegula conservatrix]